MQTISDYVLLVVARVTLLSVQFNSKMLFTASNGFSLLYQTIDTYKLIIRASDLGGRAGGNTGTGEITINIMDINDNIPTLEKEFVGLNTFGLTLAVLCFLERFSKALVAACSMLAVWKRTL